MSSPAEEEVSIFSSSEINPMPRALSWSTVSRSSRREAAKAIEAHDTERVAFAGIIEEGPQADRDLIEEVTLDTLAWRRGNPEQVAQDPRFAIAIYRAAIDSGMMGGVTYE